MQASKYVKVHIYIQLASAYERAHYPTFSINRDKNRAIRSESTLLYDVCVYVRVR